MNERSWLASIWRGLKLLCPSCGTGGLMESYLNVAPQCPHCRTALHHHRADDAPPYFTITVVAHIIVPAMLVMEKLWHPALWIHAVIWLPLTLILTLWLLPRVKGGIVGLQWALGMHGFGEQLPAAPGQDGPAA